MSDWIIHEPENANDPFEIETDGPFARVYSGLGPKQKAYDLIDAMKWVAYRMDIGDRIVTRRRSTLLQNATPPNESP